MAVLLTPGIVVERTSLPVIKTSRGIWERFDGPLVNGMEKATSRVGVEFDLDLNPIVRKPSPSLSDKLPPRARANLNTASPSTGRESLNAAMLAAFRRKVSPPVRPPIIFTALIGDTEPTLGISGARRELPQPMEVGTFRDTPAVNKPGFLLFFILVPVVGWLLLRSFK